MINIIWFLMIASGIIMAVNNGKIDIITQASLQGAEQAVTIAFGLIGIISFWSGMMKIAEDAGLMEFIAKVLQPLGKLLFPEIPKGHKAMGAILLSMSANFLGLGNACTPLSLKAMDEIQKINKDKTVASDSMCTFVAITSSSLTVIPSTVIAFRVAQGSANPTEIIGTTIIATFASTLTAFTFDRVLKRFSRRGK